MSTTWTRGNKIALLENGEEYYPRVLEAIANARREVQLETFILFEDKVGLQLHEALLKAASNGAQVDLLIDGWGSPDLSEPFLKSLTDAGVRLRIFEPAKRLFGKRLNLFRRMHRKIVVIDAERAFVGGINFSLDHLREFGPMGKQDYAVEITGPLVQEIHRFCTEESAASLKRFGWLRRRHRPEKANQPSRATVNAEGATAAFVTRDNQNHRTDIERHYRAAIRLAQKRIVIANAYFFPGYRLLREMRKAARRGVDVTLILQGEPDMQAVKTFAETLYAHLIRAGVKVYEYCERPLHGKVAVIDDEWATVGSSNLDPTSLALNMEANVFIRDRGFNRVLSHNLQHLLDECCRQVQLAEPSRVQYAWAVVRGFFIFHFLRAFPNIAKRLPDQKAVVRTLSADAA